MRSILVLLLASCGPKAAPVATPATPVTPPAPAPLPAWAVDVRGSMDMAVDPC
ncbi:MAG: hypothetical protein RLZZ299_1925, partial [Pseudomonadota bacterium]